MSKLAKIVEMPRAWWIRLGAELSDKIIEHTRDKKLDVNGRRFDSLSPKYAERKASGKIRRADANSRGANLWLTGDMLSDLNVKGTTRNSVKIGWGSFESDKVVGNARRGRVITSKEKPLSRMVEKFAQKMIDIQTQKNIRKNDTVNRIKLGK